MAKLPISSAYVEVVALHGRHSVKLGQQDCLWVRLQSRDGLPQLTGDMCGGASPVLVQGIGGR